MKTALPTTKSASVGFVVPIPTLENVWIPTVVDTHWDAEPLETCVPINLPVDAWYART